MNSFDQWYKTQTKWKPLTPKQRGCLLRAVILGEKAKAKLDWDSLEHQLRDAAQTAWVTVVGPDFFDEKATPKA